jgi:tetraprenyl-beta-curcumene synthase
VSAFGDRQLVARASVALLLANGRYWMTVAPLVRAQLNRWEERARVIPDPGLQALALEKLRAERFNAETVAMLATLAPSSHRASAVEAIVALEIIFDYLDGLTESPLPSPLEDGLSLSRALTDALNLHTEPSRDYYAHRPRAADGGYLEELVSAVRVALARLPAVAATAEVAQKSAAMCAEAQVRVHASRCVGTAQLEQWATREALGTALGWREFVAGAAGAVLAVHALIAAAADHRTTHEEAVKIDAVYLSLSALTTMLDSLIDYEQDVSSTGKPPWFIQYYEDREGLTHEIASVTRHAAMQARSLPNGPHHVMVLVGVVAYYTSAPTATSEFARPVTAHINRELRPLITPTLALMRAWRLAKALRHTTVERQRPPKRRPRR